MQSCSVWMSQCRRSGPVKAVGKESQKGLGVGAYLKWPGILNGRRGWNGAIGAGWRGLVEERGERRGVEGEERVAMKRWTMQPKKRAISGVSTWKGEDSGRRRWYSVVNEKKGVAKGEKERFKEIEEYTRLAGNKGGEIDEFGNYTTENGVKMPTQSSGGLTQRKESNLGSLDVFGEEGAVVTAYSPLGFVINELYSEGPLLCFPDRYWSWRCSNMDDLSASKLAPIWLRNPVPRTFFLVSTDFRAVL